LSLARLGPILDRAFSLPRLHAVALAINSPGGSAVQSALIGKRIRDLAAEKGVPVVAFVEDVAASGGYWLACAADEIYANANSIIGSIGVVYAGFGAADLLRRLGLQRRLYTAGERKAMLDPFGPENEEDVERLKAMQRDIHEHFQAWVRERRGDRLRGLDADLFSGEFWIGSRARELGLIDGLDDLRSAMRRRFGDQVRLRVVGQRTSRWRRWLAPGASEAPVGLSAQWADDLLAAVESRALWSRFGL
jgi:signal peptide peptidase SppA